MACLGFRGGDADGIQTGVAVNILNNQFKDIQENGPNHTDSVQLIGAPGAVVRGNYFLNCATGIVAYDGVERAVIEDNVLDVFVGGANPTDRSGFRLATGSPGKGAASDGTDVGIR